LQISRTAIFAREGIFCGGERLDCIQRPSSSAATVETEPSPRKSQDRQAIPSAPLAVACAFYCKLSRKKIRKSMARQVIGLRKAGGEDEMGRLLSASRRLGAERRRELLSL